MRVRLGLCGFTMAMEDYALYFPVVEVQNTFYEPPRDEVMQRWRAVTAPTLEYTMKVWQLVTHAAGSPTYRRMKRPLAAGAEPGFFRETAAVAEGWQRSVHCAAVLKATALLFQCPASFAPDPENIDRMRRFFGRIKRPAARLLWEPRGGRWLAARSLALSLCQELDLVHVVDPFVTPPDPGQPVYWRLHGPAGPRSSYSDEQLQQLREMLGAVTNAAPRYVMFNNLPRVGDAKRFAQLIADNTRPWIDIAVTDHKTRPGNL
jgi:uncharacterized protein YecE (DUF72 family)